MAIIRSVLAVFLGFNSELGILLTPVQGMFGGLLAMSSFQASEYLTFNCCVGISLTRLKAWATQ